MNKFEVRVILALVLMKNIWRILLALLIPLNLAMICVYVNYLLMREYKPSGRYGLSCYGLLDCASEPRMLISFLLGYSTIGLILLSFFLPIIVILRNRSVKPTKLFD